MRCPQHNTFRTPEFVVLSGDRIHVLGFLTAKTLLACERGYSDSRLWGPKQNQLDSSIGTGLTIRSMLERYYQHKDLVTEERVKLVHDIYQRNYENFEKRSRAISRSTKGNYNETLSYKGKHISEWGEDLEVPGPRRRDALTSLVRASSLHGPEG